MELEIEQVTSINYKISSYTGKNVIISVAYLIQSPAQDMID